MKRFTLGIGIMSLLVYPAMGYADYRAEVEAGFIRTEIENTNANSLGVASRFYFNEVHTGDYPLAEAAFLDKSSSVYLSYLRTDTSGVDVDVDTAGVGVEFLDKNIPIYFAANAVNVHRVEDDKDDDEEDVKSFSLSAGGFVNNNILLYGTWHQLQIDKDRDMDTFGPAIKYVHEFGGGGGLNLEAAVKRIRYSDDRKGVTDKEETGSGYSFAGDFYLNRRFSIGASYGSSEIREVETTVFGVRSRIFFTENLSLVGGYSKTTEKDTDDDSSVDIETLSVAIAFRFGSGSMRMRSHGASNKKAANKKTSDGRSTLACDEQYKHLFSSCQ